MKAFNPPTAETEDTRLKDVYIEWCLSNKFDYTQDEQHILKHLRIMFPHIYTSLMWLKSRPDEYEHSVSINIPAEGDSNAYWINFWWDYGRIQIDLETIVERAVIGQVHLMGLILSHYRIS